MRYAELFINISVIYYFEVIIDKEYLFQKFGIYSEIIAKSSESIPKDLYSCFLHLQRMFEKIIAEQNKQWIGTTQDAGIPRKKLEKLIQYIDKKQILVITGIRRAGKSYLLKQVIEHLLRNKTNAKNIFFLNLETPYFDEYRDKVLYMEKIFEEYLSLAEPQGKLFVFLDEVQFFKNWQVFVKARYETNNIKFFLTGSNSWLLSSEYATLLSGRTVHFELYPFSFREFCTAKNIDTKTKIALATNESKIKKALNEYLIWGGFPEIVFIDSEEQKSEILINYYNNIVYRDIIPRFGIANIRQTQELAHYLLSNISKTTSYNQLSKIIGISDKTVKEYIHYFIQGYLLFEVNIYAPSLKKQIVNPKKIYAGDVGFTRALGFSFSEDTGRFLENVVFLELKRRGYEIYYFKDKRECDFIVKERKKDMRAFQVCSLITPENREREFEGLKEAMDKLHIKCGTILTLDQEESDEKISVIPVWKWLLQE